MTAKKKHANVIKVLVPPPEPEPKPFATRPTRHSYSSYKLWNTCPAAWKHRYIDKLSQPAGPAALRGQRLHTGAERFFKGEIPAAQLAQQFDAFQAEIEEALRFAPAAEAVWLCGPDWMPVFPDNDGNDPPLTWIKSIIDLSWINNKVLHIVDFKSGRIYPDHKDQLELYAIIGAARFPHVEVVDACAWYLDLGIVETRLSHRRPWLEALRGPWSERLCAIEADDKLMPTPSTQNCRFCAFGKSKGGPCEWEFLP
jgi:hypothetical protein